MAHLLKFVTTKYYKKNNKLDKVALKRERYKINLYILSADTQLLFFHLLLFVNTKT